MAEGKLRDISLFIGQRLVAGYQSQKRKIKMKISLPAVEQAYVDLKKYEGSKLPNAAMKVKVAKKTIEFIEKQILMGISIPVDSTKYPNLLRRMDEMLKEQDGKYRIVKGR